MNELVKWNPDNSDARKIDQELALIRRGREVTRYQPDKEIRNAPIRQPAAMPRFRSGEVFDLRRVCTVHDKPYVARYIAGQDGMLRYAQSIRTTKELFTGQYEDNPIQELHAASFVFEDEECAWCGAHGSVAVRCTKCGHEVCYGRTVNRYFHCRASCGNEGQLIREQRHHKGVKPLRRSDAWGG